MTRGGALEQRRELSGVAHAREVRADAGGGREIHRGRARLCHGGGGRGAHGMRRG